MKYLISIICLLLAVTILTVVVLWPQHPTSPDDVVLTVNDSQITLDMIEKTKIERASHHDDRSALINSVIVEHLLIQEAQRQKIDEEPEFREAIKTFYEQSLIKILLDRRAAQINNGVTEQEVDTFLSYLGKPITFSTVRGSGTVIDTIDWSKSRRNTVLFDDLSSTMQPLLAGLEPGKSRTIFDTGNEWFAVRVEEIGPLEQEEKSDLSRERVRSMIAASKRDEQLNSWVNSLLLEANISIKTDQE